MATTLTSLQTGVTPQESVGSTTVKSIFDADDYNVDVSVTGALELIKIPAGAYVNWAGIQIETAETDAVNTVVLDIGDGDVPDGWMVDVDAESTGWSSSAAFTLTEGAPNTVSPANYGGKYYSASDTIDVTPSHDLDDIKFTLVANYTLV